MKVHSPVEGGGSIRSVVVDKVSRNTLETIIRANVSSEAYLRTDTAQYYVKSGFSTASHVMVNHCMGEYVRGDAHTSTPEGYYSVFKRGMKGVISAAQESTCTGTWPSSIFTTTTARSSVSLMKHAQIGRFAALRGNG